MPTTAATRTATDPTVVFLRHLDRLADRADEQTGVIIRRVQADVLELVIRRKRRELGIKA
jgi:hypothetical protein